MSIFSRVNNLNPPFLMISYVAILFVLFQAISNTEEIFPSLKTVAELNYHIFAYM